MPHTKRSITFMAWLISLINPPPLHSLSQLQKVARVLIFTVSLLTICVLSSMLAAAGIFILQNVGHMFSGFPELVGDITIIFISMLVNALCIMTLIKIKNADQKIIPPAEVLVAPKSE